MSTTITLLNLGDSNDVDVTVFSAAPKTDFKVIDTVTDPAKGSREAEYQKVTGDEEYPMTMRVGRYVNARAEDGIGRTNTSLKLSTFVQKTDVDDVIWTLPGWVTIAISMPGTSGIPDTAAVIELITNAFSWLVPVDAGVLSADALDEVKFGVVNGLTEHADSSSV